MLVSPYVRTVKTAPGAWTVQIVHSSRRGPRDIEQIRTLIDDLGDLITALKDAEPDHKFEVYPALQLKLIYEPETETVQAYVGLGQHRKVWFVSEGGLEPPRPIRALAPQASASAIPPPGPASSTLPGPTRRSHRPSAAGGPHAAPLYTASIDRARAPHPARFIPVCGYRDTTPAAGRAGHGPLP